MAYVGTNPKIEELRARLKADPKSRLFYQLGEELRRAGAAAEAEQVLRAGLDSYPTYLAAWVSLGRACREQGNDQAAVDALRKAMQFDPENVVAARLLADAYLALGEKVEAIKKYKFVFAVLPSDEELAGLIARLDRELNPPQIPSPEPAPEAQAAPAEAGGGEHGAGAAPSLFTSEEGSGTERVSFPALEESPFDKTQPPFAEDRELAERAAGDDEPMRFAHEDSPFEEPAEGYTTASAEIERPAGFHIESAPLTAEVAAPLDEVVAAAPALPVEEEADVFAPDATVEPWMAEMNVPGPDVPEAGAAAAAEPPAAPGGSSAARIARLEGWLSRVAKKGEDRV